MSDYFDRIVIVTGGRDYADEAAVGRALAEQKRVSENILVVQGGANGADRLARKWCDQHGHACATIHPAWKAKGPAAGPARNSWMFILFDTDVTLAFPGGRGTADCIRKSKLAGVPVIQERPA